MSAPSSCLRNASTASIVGSTTALLLSEFLTDLVEDDAVVFSFNDLQVIVRTPLGRTLLAHGRLVAQLCTRASAHRLVRRRDT